MIYREFVSLVKNINYFDINTLSWAKRDRTLKNQLVLWQRQGRVHMLKRGVYTLNGDERQVPLTPFAISNILCSPSYISLESALAFWGLIPERVPEVTAVTPRKTAHFENYYGSFLFKKLKRERFFGFISVKDEGGLPSLIAAPEKAIFDKIYFDPLFRADSGYFIEGLRLQNLAALSKKRLAAFSRRFASKKVERGSIILTAAIEEESR